jgi:hypothetical protein
MQTIFNDTREFIFQPGIFPSAKSMISIAQKKFDRKEFENVALFEPFLFERVSSGSEEGVLKKI